MRGAYPGTFDPPTIAHLAIAEAAAAQCGLDHVELVVNREPLGKSGMRPLAARVAMLEAVAAARPWLTVVVTDKLHLADIAAEYDVLILGADKWEQVLDAGFYESVAARDDAIVRLPRLRYQQRTPDRERTGRHFEADLKEPALLVAYEDGGPVWSSLTLKGTVSNRTPAGRHHILWR